MVKDDLRNWNKLVNVTIKAVYNSVFQFDNNAVINDKCAKSNDVNVLDVSDV